VVIQVTSITNKKAIMWLVYREPTDGCLILHGRNGSEYRVPELTNLSVDGPCAETKPVDGFNDYYWLGHTCQPFRDIPTVAGDTLADRYERTMGRLAQITQAGYQVVFQWECDFDEGILTAHPELKTHPIIQHEPLNTMDALYGGRTEALRLQYKIAEGETIQDMMSLYPYICKYFKFPIGLPLIHVDDDCLEMQDMLQKDGLMKCSILPPRHLYHPVLLFRCNKRLLFCLCRSCAIQQKRTEDCMHETDAERALTGTWVMDEVRLAVQKGYKLVELYEAYEYQVTKYNPQGGDGGLFVAYIQTHS
jgi:hypothetical protein